MSMLLCVSSLDAGSKKRRGTAGAQELLIPVGARNIAMSNAFVAGVTGVEAAATNPAGVSGMSGSKMRSFVQKDQFDKFRKGLITKSSSLAKKVFTILRKKQS